MCWKPRLGPPRFRLIVGKHSGDIAAPLFTAGSYQFRTWTAEVREVCNRFMALILRELQNLIDGLSLTTVFLRLEWIKEKCLASLLLLSSRSLWSMSQTVVPPCLY
jgi:hypothetical protein